MISRLREEFSIHISVLCVMTHRYELSVDGHVHGHEDDEGKDCVEKKM